MQAIGTLEQQLLELEQRYWDAMMRKDANVTAELTDFPCVVTGTQGVRLIERDEFMKMLQDPSYRVTSAALTDVRVRLLTNDVAVVGYNVRVTRDTNGKNVTEHAADLSTWIRRAGEWRCAAHAESLVSDRSR